MLCGEKRDGATVHTMARMLREGSQTQRLHLHDAIHIRKGKTERANQEELINLFNLQVSKIKNTQKYCH